MWFHWQMFISLIDIHIGNHNLDISSLEDADFFNIKLLFAAQTYNDIKPQNLPSNNPVDTGRKLNVHKTFRRRLVRLLNFWTSHVRSIYVLCLRGMVCFFEKSDKGSSGNCRETWMHKEDEEHFTDQMFLWHFF